MAFLPVKFEELAQEILKIRRNDLTDAKSRTVVSRIYYSCFLCAREKLKEVLSLENKKIIETGEINKKRVNVHYLIIETYKRSSEPFHQSIGERLENLRKNRNKADYNLHYKISTPVLEIKSGELLRKDIEAVSNKHLLASAFSEIIQDLKKNG